MGFVFTFLPHMFLQAEFFLGGALVKALNSVSIIHDETWPTTLNSIQRMYRVALSQHFSHITPQSNDLDLFKNW